MEENQLNIKYQSLKDYLKDCGSVAVAFSGGVDSVFLMDTAYKVLGAKAAAFTCRNNSFTAHELEECRSFCDSRGIMLNILDIDQFSIPNFDNNPKDRCYICKKTIFTNLKNHAKESGFAHVMDGTNFDDTREYRPGLKALEELGIESPLKILGFTKAEIRELSRLNGIQGWNRGSFACVATRFETGTKLTDAKFRQVESCEDYLRKLGFAQYRVRVHETQGALKKIARIEVDVQDINKVAGYNREISDYFKSQGFDFVTLDLSGFKSGSMN